MGTCAWSDWGGQSPEAVVNGQGCWGGGCGPGVPDHKEASQDGGGSHGVGMCVILATAAIWLPLTAAAWKRSTLAGIIINIHSYNIINKYI